MTNVDVCVIGDTNLDIIALDSDIPKNEQTFVDDIIIKVGGGAANFASASSILGLKTRLISSVGDDEIGEYLIEKMKKIGVDVKIKKLQTKTGITIGLEIGKGEKKLFTFKGNNKFFSINDIDFKEIDCDFLQIFGFNILSNLRKDLIKIVEYAKKNGTIVGFDPDLKADISFDREEIKKILKKVDILFLNEEEMNKAGIKKFDGLMVVKMGGKGAYAVEREVKEAIEGVKENVKISTGAGDVFDAAFVHHYFYGYDLRSCLEFAQEKAIEYLTGKFRFY